MSEGSGSQREWRFYLDDMIAFAEKVQAYTEGLDQAAFVADTLTYDATVRNLELIWEAASHLPEDVRAAHDEIPPLLPVLKAAREQYV